MKPLLYLFSFLIVYGSLFPFDFDPSSYDPAMLDGLFDFALDSSSRGDLVANILLFIPFGLLAAHSSNNPSPIKRMILVLITGFTFAFVVQVAQLILPSRVPAGIDVFYNMIGCAIGCLLSLSPMGRYLSTLHGTRFSSDSTAYPPIPVLLALLWLIFGLAPFVPSIDLQLLKDHLKALLDQPPQLVWVAQSLTMWLIVFHFLQKSSSRFLAEKYYPALVGLILLGGFFIVGHQVSIEKIIGGVLAIPAWLLIKRIYSPAALATALFLTLLAINLSPFELRDASISFNWVPFSGALTGNMFINTLAIFKKLILYGSLIWLLTESRLTLKMATIGTAIFLFVGEYLQIFFTQSTPEITDSLLALLIGTTFYHYQARTVSTGTPSNPKRIPETSSLSSSAVKTAPHNPASLPYLAEMDGLRAIAALSVFFVHFNQKAGLTGTLGPFDLERFLSNGNTGVAMFFVLSGLLLALPFWKAKVEGTSPPRFANYALRRAGRILPAYYLCLFTILAAKSISGSGTSWNNIISHLLFVYNINDYNILALNQPFWTLAVEVHFYLILPLLFLALQRLSVTASMLLILLSIPALYLTNYGLVSLIVQHAEFPVQQTLLWPFSLYLSGPHSFVLTYSTLAHLPHFLIGVASARLFMSLLKRRKHNAWAFDGIFWICGFVTLVILASPLDELLQLPQGRYNFPVVPLLLAAMIISVPFSRLAKALLNLKVIAWLGAISYGIYIYHYPVQKVVSRTMDWMTFPVEEHTLLFGVTSLIITLILSQISYTLVEVPAMRWVKQRGRRHQKGGAKSASTQQEASTSPARSKPQSDAETAQPLLVTPRDETMASPTRNSHTEGGALRLNLHRYQHDFLQHIAQLSKQTLDEVCKAIILLSAPQQGRDKAAARLVELGASHPVNRSYRRWSAITVNLDSTALNTLNQLRQQTGRSQSHTLRHLIDDRIKKQRGLLHQLKTGFIGDKASGSVRLRYGTIAAVSSVFIMTTLWFTQSNAPAAYIIIDPPSADSSQQVIFDHHAHTRYSYGALSPAELVELGKLNGCTAMAITDHTSTPGAASAEQLADIALLRQQHPNMLVFAGVELNMPSSKGREHVNVIVPPALEASALQRLAKTAESSIREAAPASKMPNDQIILSLLNQLETIHNSLFVSYNHPSRKVLTVDESLEDVLRWDPTNTLFTAIEGAPGHQNATATGSYKGKIALEDRWDPVVSRVGGVWDQLLDNGYNIWGALASSDYHNPSLDRPPCEFARNHVSVAEKSYLGVLTALKAGTFWADHGHILDHFMLSIELEGLNQPLYPGSIGRLGSQPNTALTTISIRRGSGSIGAALQTEIISNCVSGSTEIVHSAIIPTGANTDSVFLPIDKPGADGASCFIRARVRLAQHGSPDLMAYSNPVRIQF